ncbi:hypothetical protein KI688_004677 [Linnemannia hyalina]|uniref:Uncharacterized protein n=1 Tax=Linnemannia hyalina TaxID=64524 RepID=A0A9P7XLG0_9FUNG|nr:hypothetical protein KI688_004677 [Linnemannia hyalina]
MKQQKLMDDKLHYVFDNNGLPLIPSYVAIFNNPSTSSNNNTNTTQILFGQEAKDQLTTNPQNTIFNWQRLIRLPYGNPIVQSEIKRVPYNIVSSVLTPPPPLTANSCPNLNHSPALKRASCTQEEDDNRHFLGHAMIQIPAHVPTLHHLYRPEELTALLVSHLKHLAETQAGINFTYTVVTIPSDDTPDQRYALDEAIEAAGLYRLRLTRRHLAPYLAYQLDADQLGVANVMMVNLDPEYLEVALVEMDEGVYETLAILERTEVRYDGEAANRLVLEYLVDKHFSRARGVTATGLLDKTLQQHTFERQQGNHDNKQLRRDKLFNDTTAMKRLHNEILKATAIFLEPSPSHSKKLVRIEIQSFFESHDLSEDLTFSQWQDLRQSTLTALLPTVQKVLESLPEYDTSINTVIVVGASPLVPDATRLLKSYFRGRGKDGKEVRFPTGIDPALAMVQGMAVVVERLTPRYDPLERSCVLYG